jgi:ribonuclease VapC
MFVDSSAFVAIFAGEPEAEDFYRILSGPGRKATSPLVILETTMRLSSLLSIHPDRVLADLNHFISQADIAIIAIEPADGEAAVRAFATYGEGRGHKARLNLADCLTYACAKSRALPILYKGADFAATDLA